MANPILDQLNNQNRQQTVRKPTPEELRMDPNYLDVMRYVQHIQQSGFTPKSAFYMMCQQRGVDPNRIISVLQQKQNENFPGLGISENFLGGK